MAVSHAIEEVYVADTRSSIIL